MTDSLDLAHGWALPDTADTTAHVDATGTAALEARENGGGKEGSEAEPEEGGGGLSLSATLVGVARTVGDAVGGGVGLERMLATGLVVAKYSEHVRGCCSCERSARPPWRRRHRTRRGCSGRQG